MPAKFPHDFQDKQTTAEYMSEATFNQWKFELVIPFFYQGRNFMLSKFFVLNSSMKLGSGIKR